MGPVAIFVVFSAVMVMTASAAVVVSISALIVMMVVSASTLILLFILLFRICTRTCGIVALIFIIIHIEILLDISNFRKIGR